MTFKASLPADYSYARASDFDPLPDKDDPLRGLSVWWPEASDCNQTDAPKPIPSPLELVVTEWISGDFNDPSDDRYEPAEIVFPGHPYFLEARFDEVPAESAFEVRVGEDRSVEVTRTGNPLVYRSDMITFMPETE